MKSTWWENLRHRIGAAWDVLTGRAWAGYGNPMEWEHVGPHCDHFGIDGYCLRCGDPLPSDV